jgi:hypothetical protein
MNVDKSMTLLREGNMDLIRKTVTAQNVNEDDGHGITWLHLACFSNSPDNGSVVTHMLDCGALIDAGGESWYTALQCAAHSNKINCVRVLLARGCAVDPVNKYGYTPLNLPTRYNPPTCARMLLDHGVQLSKIRMDVPVPDWAHSFVAGRERARSASILLMGALRRKEGGREIRYLIPLIGQWVWATRGVE